MYQRTSRRRQLIGRALVYSFMTLSVIAIVTILMLVILGYSFNRKDGRLEQGGLLQFASVPSGAFVTLDGYQLGSRTPSKASNVDARDHTVQMDLNGYRSWQKSVLVQAGGIRWLSYARLVPNEIKPESLRTFSSMAASLASSDRKWIALQEDAASPNFVLANIEGDTPKYSALSIPASIMTAAQTDTPQSFTMVAWSNEERYLLVKRVFDTDKSEWLLVDRADAAKSVNISTLFAISPSKVVFGNGSGRDLYVQTDDIVRRINLDQQTLSRPLATNIEEFSIYSEDIVVYTTKPDAARDNQRHVGYFEDGMEAEQIIFSYPGDTPNVHVAFGDYFFKRYITVTHGSTLELYSGMLPRGSTKAELRQEMSATLPADALRLTMSRNGRFAVAQNAGGYTTYDIELKKTDSTVFKQPVAVERKLQWLDDYMIWNDAGSMLRFYEFDGANQQDIMPVIEGQAATLSGNNKYLYGLSKTETGVALQRAKLIID